MDKNLESADADNDLRREEVEELLGAIHAAIDDEETPCESFINEFGDFTIAIPLNGGQKALDSAMEKQRLWNYFRDLAESLVADLRDEGKEELACCFTGHRPKKVPWLADMLDHRTERLEDTLQELMNQLNLHGVRRFIAGNAEGFDTTAAEAVLNSNTFLKMLHHVAGDGDEKWQPAELEIAIPFEGHNAGDQRIDDIQKRATVAHVVSDAKSRTRAFHERNEYMVDHSDIVIALLDDENEDAVKGGTGKTLTYALNQGKPAIVFFARWFEDGWPSIEGIKVVPPHTFRG